jgi:histidyl-tRNA synthetase
MTIVPPRTMTGAMELLPRDQIALRRMLDVIRRGYERFGFLPVETPVMEHVDVLLTKSGGETEKQVFFVQSTGTLEKERQRLASGGEAGSGQASGQGIGQGSGQGSGQVSDRPELAMRYDLTVPLARYVAQHEQQLNFPFRRYQIQRVYRGERPQKGRYREFYQCDIDVIDRDRLPLSYDAELPAVIHGIFTELAFGKFTIHLNNRKLLRGLLEGAGIAPGNHAAVLHEVDRLGKQERAEVEARVVGVAGIEAAAAARLLDTLTAPASARETLARLGEMSGQTESFAEGLRELAAVYEGTIALGVPEDALRLDLAIARGLDYYTGTVYETFLDEHRRIGSICSGGRYENLAGHYTKSKLPGVGISIGATRLFSQLLELGALGALGALGGATGAVAQVCVLRVEAALGAAYAELATELRAAGLNVEVYGGDDKLGKQLKYAVRGKVPLAVIYGAKERDAGVVRVKDLRAEQEHDVPRDRLAERVRELLSPP